MASNNFYGHQLLAVICIVLAVNNSQRLAGGQCIGFCVHSEMQKY